MIIDIQFVLLRSIIKSVKDFVTESPEEALQLFSWIERKLFTVICKDQFKNCDWWYDYPDDLKELVLYLFENLRYKQISSWQNVWILSWSSWSVKRRTVDDTTIEYFDPNNTTWSQNALFFWIPLIEWYWDILNKYKCNDDTLPFWYFTVC